MQKFGAARAALATVTDTYLPDIEEARQEVRRGRGTYVEVGYGLRKANKNADYNRFDLALSTPFGGSSRITFLYQPTLYETKQQNFNSNYFETDLNSQISERLTTHLQLGFSAENSRSSRFLSTG